ncbi:zinc finger protein [Sesbania bispinosa]|nr:zinc finger protein [Sesbania bispinosa]
MIHCANKLASRLERVWMCEVCEQAPASVTYKADAAALCVMCNSDIRSANCKPVNKTKEAMACPRIMSHGIAGPKGFGPW